MNSETIKWTTNEPIGENVQKDIILEQNKGQEQEELTRGPTGNKGDENEPELGVNSETEAGAERKAETGAESEKEISSEKSFINHLKEQGFLIEGIKEEYIRIKDRYKISLIETGKYPAENETWDQLIMKETEKYYVQHIKERVSEDDKNLLDKFLESNDENLLLLKQRQEILNIFFRNNYALYANQEDEMVSMTDYLNKYYENIGAKIKIEFKTIDPDVKRSLIRKILYYQFLWELEEKENIKIDFKNPDKKISNEISKKTSYAIESSDERIKYILDDEVAIPHLIVEIENNKIETPLTGGTVDIFGPLRSKEIDKSGFYKKKGNFVQFQMIHAPEYASGIQRRISMFIHEIDHIITENIGKVKLSKQTFKGGESLISEATAMKAGLDFMKNQHNSSLIGNFDGYDYYTNLEQVVGGASPDKYPYHIPGYIIAEAYEKMRGKEPYKKLFYTGELDIEKELGDIGEIEQEIVKSLKSQEETFIQIMRGRLN